MHIYLLSRHTSNEMSGILQGGDMEACLYGLFEDYDLVKQIVLSAGNVTSTEVERCWENMPE